VRTAIATSDYFKPGETMVNRHIALLFGGDTCVVAGRFNGNNPLERQVFERRRGTSAADLAVAPAALLYNRLKYGTSRPPFGRRKREMAEFLRRERVEAVLGEFGTQTIAVAPLAMEMGLPVFSYLRGTDASKSLGQRTVVNAYRKFIPRLDGVFAVSQALLDNLARLGISNPNSHVVPSGVDVRLFRPGQKRPRSCVAVGRMVEKKAPLITIRAFAAAAAGMPDATLVMVGDGPLIEPARALVGKLGMERQISLVGAGTHEQVRTHLAASEVFLQHSVTAADGNTEGLPTAIQEAMACGCVVVSTRHAGIPEAVSDGETGWLVAEHDEAGYARRIAQVLAGDDRERMIGAARQVAESRFDNDVLLHRVEDLMRAAVARRRAA
jgi:colanic acid/amylovoran biosynthesis glycosyltransferase